MIKTTDEYVLNLLEETKEKNRVLQAKVDELEAAKVDVAINDKVIESPYMFYYTRKISGYSFNRIKDKNLITEVFLRACLLDEKKLEKFITEARTDSSYADLFIVCDRNYNYEVKNDYYKVALAVDSKYNERGYNTYSYLIDEKENFTKREDAEKHLKEQAIAEINSYLEHYLPKETKEEQ